MFVVFVLGPEAEDDSRSNIRKPFRINLPGKAAVVVPMNSLQAKKLVPECRNGNDVTTVFAGVFARPFLAFEQVGTGEEEACWKGLGFVL